jgi:hypothetical protein
VSNSPPGRLRSTFPCAGSIPQSRKQLYGEAQEVIPAHPAGTYMSATSRRVADHRTRAQTFLLQTKWKRCKQQPCQRTLGCKAQHDGKRKGLLPRASQAGNCVAPGCYCSWRLILKGSVFSSKAKKKHTGVVPLSSQVRSKASGASVQDEESRICWLLLAFAGYYQGERHGQCGTRIRGMR